MTENTPTGDDPVSPAAVAGPVVVIGGGTMGRGIALAAVAAGLDTTLVDSNRDALGTASRYVEARADKLAADRGRTADQLQVADDLKIAVSDAAVVIEAVVERADVKGEVFRTLGRAAPAQALLASNTSTLSISELADAAGGSPRVVGMHFFNPAHRMRLVEVVVGRATSDATRVDAIGLCRVLDKEPIVVADVAWFVTSRLGLLLGNEAIRIIAEGTATAADVDTAMRLGYNHPMGPLELADLVGLDARLNNLRSVTDRMGRHEFAPPPLLVDLVEAGHLGRKTGRGFYAYDTDGNIVNGPRHG